MLQQVLLLLLAGFARCNDLDPYVVLSARDFHKVVDREPLMLVDFYAPSTGHCHACAEAASLLADLPIKLGKVDAAQEQDLSAKFVRGSALVAFRFGVPTNLEGRRDATGIANFMRNLVDRPVTTVEGAEELLGRGETVVAGFFSSATGAQSQAFLAAAYSLCGTFRFMHSFSVEVNAHFRYSDAVVIFKASGDPPAVNAHPGNASSGLVAWIYENHLPLAGILTEGNTDLYRRANKPVLKVHAYVDLHHNKKQVNEYLGRLREVAKDMPELSYTLVDCKQQGQANFGCGGAISIEDLTSRQHFVYGVENVRDFVRDFRSGKMRPHVRSEPVPEPVLEPRGKVSVVVGETFQDIVLDPTKDVVIRFYAPWNGFCKQLVPMYEKLAEAFGDVDSVVIAAIDGTANDVPHAYTTETYPAVYLAPANAKDKPILFRGWPSLDALQQWIRQKVSIPIPQLGENVQE